MADRPNLDQIINAVTALNAAAITLTQHAGELARDPTATLTTLEDVHEYLADALATALDALPPETLCDEHHQLRGALANYLSGWAG